MQQGHETRTGSPLTYNGSLPRSKRTWMLEGGLKPTQLRSMYWMKSSAWWVMNSWGMWNESVGNTEQDYSKLAFWKGLRGALHKKLFPMAEL